MDAVTVDLNLLCHLYGDDFEVSKAEQIVFSKMVVNILPVDVVSK